MDKNNIIFKPGEKVSCIGDDLHIECTIVSDDGEYKVKVEDTLTGRHLNNKITYGWHNYFYNHESHAAEYNAVNLSQGSTNYNKINQK